MRQVPSGASSTTCASQILSYSVRGLAILVSIDGNLANIYTSDSYWQAGFQLREQGPAMTKSAMAEPSHSCPSWRAWAPWLWQPLGALASAGASPAPACSSSPAGTSSAVVSAIRATAFDVQSSFSIWPLRLKRLVEPGDLVVGEIGDLLELDKAELVQLGLELRRDAGDQLQSSGSAGRPLEALEGLALLAPRSWRSGMRAALPRRPRR